MHSKELSFMLPSSLELAKIIYYSLEGNRGASMAGAAAPSRATRRSLALGRAHAQHPDRKFLTTGVFDHRPRTTGT